MPALPIETELKPRLRGAIHLTAFLVSLGGLVALAGAPVQGWRLAAGLVYGVSLSAMLGFSALYHLPSWSFAARRRMRRLDHSGIFLLIAGTYTPLAALLSPDTWTWGLVWMWTCALAGIVQAWLINHGKRALRAGAYVLMGLSAVPLVGQLPLAIGWWGVTSLLGGAAIYIAGAVVYARRWPDPSPSVFGYHEVFHAMVVAAAALHFSVVWQVQH
jgi:hemolysin III